MVVGGYPRWRVETIFVVMVPTEPLANFSEMSKLDIMFGLYMYRQGWAGFWGIKNILKNFRGLERYIIYNTTGDNHLSCTMSPSDYDNNYCILLIYFL